MLATQSTEWSNMTAIRKALPYDYSVCKLCAQRQGRILYRLKRGMQIYECRECGFHYIDYLDEIHREAHKNEIVRVSEKDYEYINGQLQSNARRFQQHLAVVMKYVDCRHAKCLDVGAGGGLFLNILRGEGAEVQGIEPDAVSREFAKQKYQIQLSSKTIEASEWMDDHQDSFDAVTLWDVIEHVNFPSKTLLAAFAGLKPGGYLFLDTPARDSFYYRMGKWSYRLTRGRCPTFLNMMYSNTPFAHKQIFASDHLKALMEKIGFELISIKKIHELSFPYTFYLKKIVKSELLAKLVAPVAAGFFMLCRIRNKMIIVARKPSADVSTC